MELNDDDLLTEFDAKVWADRFVKRVRENPSIATHRETMTAWFAGAIMSGWDKGKGRRGSAPKDRTPGI